jgi:hypothetical protein
VSASNLGVAHIAWESHRLRRRSHVGAGEQPGWASKLHHEDVAMAVQGRVGRETARQVAPELVQSWAPLKKAPKVERREAAPHTPPPLTSPLLVSPIQPPGPRLQNHLAPPRIFRHPPNQCPSSPPPNRALAHQRTLSRIPISSDHLLTLASPLGCRRRFSSPEKANSFDVRGRSSTNGAHPSEREQTHPTADGGRIHI